MNNDPLVCVVDDEEGIRSLIGQALEGEGYRVATYPDGESFLDAADADPPDLVFLDINMPGMNGWEVQETMAKRGDLDPTVIAVTARGGRSVRKCEGHEGSPRPRRACDSPPGGVVTAAAPRCALASLRVLGGSPRFLSLQRGLNGPRRPAGLSPRRR
ncbi:hypothetical protein BRD56_04425 [Thermoplasmatales archaeon SW_10_69_26]|nr:MAG: hypothetical protein BRD56_04425 [Thermoplasmatales archaeon SW_10_69_26]